MRIIVWLIISLGFVTIGWYLFVRPFEYEVNFKARTVSGDIIETIRLWDRTLNNTEILKVDSVDHLRQRVTLQDRTYIYDWYFKIVNDTTSQVNIKISEPSCRITNKLLVPFVNRAIEVDAKDFVNKFYELLKIHLDITSVKIEGEAETPEIFCLCKTVETTQIGKANGMMKDYNLLTSFIDEFKLIVNGAPLVRITKWNHSQGLLKYDFCFPIVRTDSLPEADEIKYVNLHGKKSLKAIYHGNYITSDRAWYSLYNYAITHGYKIDGLPIEMFYNNPNMGGNEKAWKAEILLPVK